MRLLFAVITMYDQEIKLVREKTGTDEYADRVSITTERSVFAELKSVGQSEFYQAQAVGLKPELKFVLADYLEYQNEKLLKFKDYNDKEEQIYTIIRTYRTGNEIELVCKRGVD